MNLPLGTIATTRASRWAAVVIVVAGAAMLAPALRAHIRGIAASRALRAAVNALDYRLAEGRSSEAFEHRQMRAMRGAAALAEIVAVRATAAELRAQWESNRTSETARRAGVALFAAGEPDRAVTTLVEALRRATGERDPLRSIVACDDPALLIDFSAAALQRAAAHDDARDLLLAFEAADRAWRLDRRAGAAWNRALAEERIGVPAAAVRSWEEVLAVDHSSNWSNEAKTRHDAALHVATARIPESTEIFFHRHLVARVTAILADAKGPERVEVADADPIRSDHLASDTLAAVRRVRHGSEGERIRLVSAFASYTRGRAAFENDLLDEAHSAFARAESELSAFHVPFALLAREQRIRCQCSKADQPGCLEELQTFRAQLLASGRYPWLAGRAAMTRGQSFYRRGRIYEAAEWFHRGNDELRVLNDPGLVSVTNTMLGNAYAAAGETDIALAHYLEAIRRRSTQAGDRRRRQLEDVVMFLLRHGFIATSELLLDEIHPLASTEAGRVLESTLRGIVAGRRGDAAAASRHFVQSHMLLAAVKDPDAHADVQRSLAIAESESQLLVSGLGLEQLDAAIAQHEHDHYAIWLPQLLAKRGGVFEERNEPQRAESDYRRAIDILEHREPRLDQSVLSLGVVSDQSSAFDRCVRLLLNQQRIAAALSIAERASVLRISALHARGMGVRDVFGAARSGTGGDGVSATQRVLRGNQVAVVQYLLRDELVTWTVTPREIRATRRRLRSQDLIGAVDDLRGCAARPGCRDDDALELASSLLIHDWIASVPRDAVILIQPPGELQAVPFPMLKTGEGEPLLARNAVAVAPSLRAFARAVDVDVERTGEITALFAAAARPGGGHDPLPLAVSEATRASRFYAHASVVTHATRKSFLELAPLFSVVHFAGHVIVNDERPLRSAIVFDVDGDGDIDSELLQMHEIDERSFAKARIVVLSGCETGRAPRPTMSIANALLSQSAPSVVFSSWPVEDEAAQEFALAFHQALAAGRGRAEAVREAELAMFRNHPDRPDRWAAFALAGAPGSVTESRKGDER